MEVRRPEPGGGGENSVSVGDQVGIMYIPPKTIPHSPTRCQCLGSGGMREEQTRGIEVAGIVQFTVSVRGDAKLGSRDLFR